MCAQDGGKADDLMMSAGKSNVGKFFQELEAEQDRQRNSGTRFRDTLLPAPRGFTYCQIDRIFEGVKSSTRTEAKASSSVNLSSFRSIPPNMRLVCPKPWV